MKGGTLSTNKILRRRSPCASTKGAIKASSKSIKYQSNTSDFELALTDPSVEAFGEPPKS